VCSDEAKAREEGYLPSKQQVLPEDEVSGAPLQRSLLLPLPSLAR
jgi:hypothetical protein